MTCNHAWNTIRSEQGPYPIHMKHMCLYHKDSYHVCVCGEMTELRDRIVT